MLIQKKSLEYQDDILRLIPFYRVYPSFAATQLLRTGEGEPLMLDFSQAVVIDEWMKGSFCVLTATRGYGKTFLSAVCIALKIMLYPNIKIGIFAPAYRQAEFIFTEFEKLYNNSPALQACLAKPPSKTPKQCIAITKKFGKAYGESIVKALPVGNDGGKIRGERFNMVFLDECAQLPETIFRSAIQPMLSTASNPMANVKKVAKLKKEGVIDPAKLLSSNGYIAITSGFYQFNYWWPQILESYKNILNGSQHHKLHFRPHWDLSEGFLDKVLLEESRRTSPDHVFRTEWCAEWVSDSDGVFPMSLLESIRNDNLEVYSKTGFKGRSDYVFGIDVARSVDSTAVVIVKLGRPSQVVWISELTGESFPDQAVHILNLIQEFNPSRIYMDSGGGGLGLKDLLKDPSSLGMPAILASVEVDTPALTKGEKRLVMCNFTTSFWSQKNNNAKTLMEQRFIELPGKQEECHIMAKRGTNEKEENLVDVLIKQTASIVITQTGRSGALHFDLPVSANSKGYKERVEMKVKKKDIYTAFMLACAAVYDLAFKQIEEYQAVPVGVVKTVEQYGVNRYSEQRSSTINKDRPSSSRSAKPNNKNNTLVNPVNRSVVPGQGIIVSRRKNDPRRR